MKASKVRKHITNSRHVFVPCTVGENTVWVPVQKSAFKEILASYDKDVEFPATLRPDGEDVNLHFGVDTV